MRVSSCELYLHMINYYQQYNITTHSYIYPITNIGLVAYLFKPDIYAHLVLLSMKYLYFINFYMFTRQTRTI